jgi:hypothetical protein
MKTFWTFTGFWLISIGVVGFWLISIGVVGFWHNPWTLALGLASSVAFGGYALYMGR